MTLQTASTLESIYQFTISTTTHGDLQLENYKDHSILFVNTASHCGFTPQYKGLEELNHHPSISKLLILAFPCNQFGKQEPGSAEEIKEFCTLNYGVSFPIATKIDVNGPNTHPLYKLLKEQKPGFLNSKKIKWNFTKFLLLPHAQKLIRFAPMTPISKIQQQLINL